jgi:acyl carrier protein
MAEALEDRVRRVVSEVLGMPLAKVTVATSRDDVESWDSLNVVNLMIALEAEFGVTLAVDEAVDLLSVPLVIAVLRRKGVT